MLDKKCLDCNKKFKVHNYRINAKYCSTFCYQKNWRTPKNAHKIKKGQRLSPKTEFQKGKLEPKGALSLQWKGDKATYSGKHAWVKRNKGLPEKCEHCGKNGLKGKKIHWANIDHKYKRKLEDYIRLCPSCHGIYDFKMGLRKKHFKKR